MSAYCAHVLAPGPPHQNPKSDNNRKIQKIITPYTLHRAVSPPPLLLSPLHTKVTTADSTREPTIGKCSLIPYKKSLCLRIKGKWVDIITPLRYVVTFYPPHTGTPARLQLKKIQILGAGSCMVVVMIRWQMTDDGW